MAARVTHPHIVTMYDTGEDDVPFIVMELLPGRTLADEIAEGPLQDRRLHQIATEVLSALEAAHARGVLHRDIKPGNVLIATDDHAKVADFGIAKTTDDASETTALFGTAAYLAPERLAGHQASPPPTPLPTNSPLHSRRSDPTSTPRSFAPWNCRCAKNLTNGSQPRPTWQPPSEASRHRSR